jgi:hypothetical protein
MMTASALRVHGSPPAHLDIIPRMNEILFKRKGLQMKWLKICSEIRNPDEA